jgi:hypothetical protein
MMKKLFNQSYDCTDYLLANNIEPIANLVANLSDLAKTASVPSHEDMNDLEEEEVALILFHPRLGELRKFACDSPGITEINLNLLAQNADSLPDEIVKVAANNLGYVAKNLKIEIPEKLLEYQTGE